MLNNGSRYLAGAGEGAVPQWHGVYPAVVVSNADPKGQGALQLQVPMVSGTTVTAWAPPLGPYTALPAPNTAIQCMFLGGDVQHPVWVWNEKITSSSVGANSTTYSVEPPASPNLGDIWYPVTTSGGTTTYGNPQVWSYNSGTQEFSWETQGNLDGTSIADGTIGVSSLNDGVTAQALGGVQVSSGTYADIPGAANTGSLYIATDQGDAVYSYDGGWSLYQFGSQAIQEGGVTLSNLGSDVIARSLGGNTTYVGPAEPPNDMSTNLQVGDLWIDTTNSANNVNRWSGSAWVAYTVGNIQGTQVAPGAIDTPQIAQGAVTADNIEAGTIVAGIVDGTEIISAQFIGENFIINSAGAFWYQNGV